MNPPAVVGPQDPGLCQMERLSNRIPNCLIIYSVHVIGPLGSNSSGRIVADAEMCQTPAIALANYGYRKVCG